MPKINLALWLVLQLRPAAVGLQLSARVVRAEVTRAVRLRARKELARDGHVVVLALVWREANCDAFRRHSSNEALPVLVFEVAGHGGDNVVVHGAV